MIYLAAHLIVVPYLWAFGYERDPASVDECHRIIAKQAKEAEDEDCTCAFDFYFSDSK